AEAAEPIGLLFKELLERLRRARLRSFGHAAAHNGRAGKCHPGLTCRRAAPNSGANALQTVPPRLARTRKKRERREPRALLPYAGDLCLGAEEPDHSAVRHPVGLDASDALHRRLPCRRQMALRLFALQLP